MMAIEKNVDTEENGGALSDVSKLEQLDLMYKWEFWFCRITFNMVFTK